MFADIRPTPRRLLAAHGDRYRRWARPLLAQGELVGIIAQTLEKRPVASGCVWFQPVQPRVLQPRTRVPYILSMFTDRRHRGRGLATAIVERLIAEARRRGYGWVTLHASDQGRPVYERLGFEPTREMRLLLDPRLRRRLRPHRRA